MGVFFQILGSFIVCSLTMSTGIIFAWPSSTTLLFKSENTTLYRPMSSGEIGLLGSLSSAGALASTPILAMLIDRLGRKNSSMLCGLMNVIGWTIIAFSRKVEVIMVGIFIAGLGGGAFLIVAVFVSEFCQESIRGAMSSGSMVMYGVGILLSYLTGGLLDYWENVYVCLALTVVNLGLLGWLKESPMFLLLKGREKEAAVSIAFYRRVKPSSKEVVDELEKLRRTINAVEEEISPEEEKLKPKNEKKETLKLWQFFKKSRSTRRALLITIILMTASIFQGLVVVQVYAEPLFEKTVPDMPTTVATVIFAVINVVSGFLAAYLTEVCGRKPLIIYPSIGASICCLICGLQLYTSFGPNWLIPLFIYAYATCFTFGAATVPFVLLAEVFLPEVKSYMTMIIVEWTWLCNFLILIVFDPLMNAIGLGPVFFIFSAICLLTSIFSIFFVPETKGLPLDEIQGLLVPKKHRENKVNI